MDLLEICGYILGANILMFLLGISITHLVLWTAWISKLLSKEF